MWIFEHFHLLTACHCSACLAEDCFELGRLSYNDEDHYHTIMWMEEALIKNREEEDPVVDTASILDYLAFSSYMVMLLLVLNNRAQLFKASLA